MGNPVHGGTISSDTFTEPHAEASSCRAACRSHAGHGPFCLSVSGRRWARLGYATQHALTGQPSSPPPPPSIVLYTIFIQHHPSRALICPLCETNLALRQGTAHQTSLTKYSPLFSPPLPYPLQPYPKRRGRAFCPRCYPTHTFLDPHLKPPGFLAGSPLCMRPHRDIKDVMPSMKDRGQSPEQSSSTTTNEFTSTTFIVISLHDDSTRDGGMTSAGARRKRHFHTD